MKGVVVQKFGGTSVGSGERISAVADRIAIEKKTSPHLVVVVSAMAGETDRLQSLGRQLNSQPPLRELDVLLATGEQQTSALLALALSARGISSTAIQGFQIPIRTTSEFGQASIQSVAPQRIERLLEQGNVVVVAGYQGVNDGGEITTLGRGGSDLTAVAVAVSLQADRCEIYTDVPGVFTADPQICPDARLIERISYDEMLELASLGAKVLQARSVQLGKRYHVPIRVLSSFDAGPGTWVVGEEKAMEGTVVAAVTCDRKEGQISVRKMPDPVQAASKLFGALSDAQVIVDVIVQDRSSDGNTNVTFTVPRDDFQKALRVVEQICKGNPQIQILQAERIAKVSAVGLGMRSHSGVAAKMFQALAKEGIEVMAVSTSDIKISCVIEDRYAELAVRTLHDAFGLAKEAN